MIRVQKYQSLLDLALQIYGDARAVFDLAAANDISVTAVLAIGTELVTPESVYSNSRKVAFYALNNVQPATDKALTLFEEGLFITGLFS